MTWSLFTKSQNGAYVMLMCVSLPYAPLSFSAHLDYGIRGLFSMPHHLHLGTSHSGWPLTPATCREMFWLFFHEKQNCITVLASWFFCPKAMQPFTDAVSFIGYREFIPSCPTDFTLLLRWLFILSLYSIHRGDLLTEKLQRSQTFSGKPSIDWHFTKFLL